MPITTKWWLIDHVIEVKLIGNFTIADLHQAAVEAIKLIEMTPIAQVHILVDNTLIGQTEARAADMNRVAQPLMQHERLSWVIVYGKNNVLTRFASNIVMQLVHPRFRMVNTLAEALAFLSYLDDSVPTYEQWRTNTTTSQDVKNQADDT